MWLRIIVSYANTKKIVAENSLFPAYLQYHVPKVVQPSSYMPSNTASITQSSAIQHVRGFLVTPYKIWIFEFETETQ